LNECRTDGVADFDNSGVPVEAMRLRIYFAVAGEAVVL
jgi:hypothetical protein